MKIMVVGDTHGMSGVIERKAQIAKAVGVDRMLVVGDFGLWPGTGGMHFLDDCQRVAQDNNLNIYALPGNHEDHNQWNWLVKSPHLPKDDDGFTYVRSNVLLSKRIQNWKWAGKRFFIAGGAVSIDRAQRTVFKSWWPDEQLSDSELESIQKYQGPKIDYLFTHDCSNYTPWGFHLVPDPDSQVHRQKIDKVIQHLGPKMHFHGHMHHKYEWENWYNNHDEPTLTYGLDCNGEDASWGILDTKADQFYWDAQAVMKFDPAFAI